MAISHDFSFNIQQLCSFCYRENRYKIFKDEKCVYCQKRNINPVYVNAKNHEEFVRDFRNSGISSNGTNFEQCRHPGIVNKYHHATINRGCSFAVTEFEYFVWNWMKSHKKYKISDIFTMFIAPFIFTQKTPCIRQNVPINITPKEHPEKINPIPQSHTENEIIQKEDKKKQYFCWFCFKHVASEHEIAVHVSGNDHNLFYENDKKRRWYFKMPKSKQVMLCKETNCDCLAPHADDEYREMNARIKFRNFNFKTFDLEKKTINPWPKDIQLQMPLFPSNIECYSKSLRITVKLTLANWTIGYVCFRGDVSRPYYCLYDNQTNQKGQFLKFDFSQTNNCDNINFDIEFSPLCSGTYLQKVEFGFILSGKEFCCQKLIRVDVGTSQHLAQFRNIWDRYHLALKRSQNEKIINYLKTFSMDFKDFKYERIIPFSIPKSTSNSILNENLLRRVFRVVSNLNWLNSRVEPWNYIDWMKDMLVHEELEQQFILSQLIYIGDVIIANNFTKESFIPARSGQLYGTVIFKKDPQNSVARDFVTRNVIKAFILNVGFENKLSLHECDLVDLIHYEVESRSIKEVTLCLPELAVQSLQAGHNKNLRHTTVFFRFNRMKFERWHNALEKMPHYDGLAYAPLCCPSFTHLPYGEAESSVTFNPLLRLNQEQLRLPRLVLRNIKNDEIVLPFILNGAFGTGKTSVIAETVRTILVNSRKRSRILICTRSYSAGKVYLKMFQSCLPENVMQKIRLIIPSYRLKREVNEYLSITVVNEKLSRDIFEKNRVFITSLDNVTYAMSLVAGGFTEENPMFEYLFVDEAAQVLEIDAVMVYQFGNKKSKFIFAGDVFQVRPEYYNKSLKKFALPIVSRLHNMYQRCADYEICLKEVYRSHPDLVKYLSVAIYYDCGLTSSMIPSFPNLKPMKFIDSNKDGRNQEQFDDMYCSFTNELEAKMIIMGVETLLRSQLFHPENILICSPFFSQVKMIRDKLKKLNLRKISVEQPTAIQGREYDAVFITTVLTVNNELKYPIHHSTFHSDKTLINLAISRARHYVEVVGDKQCLLEQKCKDQWNKFLHLSV